MISLLYHSHTVVPGHLAELETMDLVEPDEQILVALDGVLLDGNGQRLSGPTLHDYCLISSLRVILWARDYGRHLCYAFPLAELVSVEGTGLDPLHAQVQLIFAAPGEEEQQFTLALLPLANLQAALSLLRLASESARALAAYGVPAREAGPEIMSVMGEQIYGHVDGLRPNEAPYRWPGATNSHVPTTGPTPAFQVDPASLPPGQVYAAGRLARSAWDTLRRSMRDVDMPELNGGSLRDLTEAVRAINDLVQTVAGNPAAQQMAMAFINRNGARGASAPEPPRPEEAPAADEPMTWASQVAQSLAGQPSTAHQMPAEPAQPPSSYHEIPLRRRGTPPPSFACPSTDAPLPPVSPAEPPQRSVAAPPPREAPVPDRREIPLRRRPMPANAFVHGPRPAARSGSGDAESDD